MKDVFYSVTYTDGMKQFFNKKVDESYDTSNISDQLFESNGIRNVKLYNNESEFNSAKKQI